MELDITIINNYVSLCNFNDKRQGRATLIDAKQVDNWGHSLRGKVNYKHIYHLSDGYNITIPMLKYKSINGCICGERHKSFEHIEFHIQEFDDKNILKKLLEITNNKMSLCGGSVLCNMSKRGTPNDYDFFFHCDSVSEADDLLKLCMKTIADNYKEEHMKVTYNRSQGAQTVVIVNKEDISSVIKLQFIRRNYQFKDQILLGFDLPCCQYGFNLGDGFFTTIPGGMAFALGIFPLDLTQRSLSFGFRLRKYTKRGFVILLPGIKDFKLELKTPDGILHRFREEEKRLDLNPYLYKNVFWNSEISGETPKLSDYDGEPQNNWYYIATDKKYNVTFSADDWEELYNMSEYTIRKRLFLGSWYYHYNVYSNDVKLKHAALFLGDKIGEYVTNLIQNKKKECIKIWKSKIKDYENKAVDIYNKMLLMPFRFENPSGQNFGKNNPIITKPSEWYGKDYEPVIVGISNDRMISFNSCFTNWPKDMLNLICFWWLIAEVNDARNCLFKFEGKAPPLMIIFFGDDDSSGDERNFPSSSDDY